MQLTPGSKKPQHCQGLLSNHEPTVRYHWQRGNAGFEPRISFLQDRCFDQLSHGASLVWHVCMVCYPSKAAEGWVVFKSPCSASAAAQGHTSGQPKALLGFEPRISCLLDRLFNQLSHGATCKLSLREGDSEDQSIQRRGQQPGTAQPGTARPKRVVLTTE